MPDPSTIIPVYASGSTVSPSISPAGPTYQDIMAKLNQPYAGQANFDKGINTLAPTAPGVLDPGYQKTLDNIRANANYYGTNAASTASALAARRGGAGSSVEQFGVQTALDNTNRTAADQEAQVYLSNLQRQQSLQDQTGAAYLTRAGQEGSAGTSLANTGAQLTSDELASQRNMAFQQQQLQLQALLGQQGIDLGYANIGASKNIAQQNGQYGLLGSLAGGILPSLLGGGGSGSGGLLGGLFGGGAASGYGAALAPGIAGPAGPAAGVAGIGGLGTLGLIGAAGLGSMAINNFTTPYLKNALGQTAGGTASYLMNPIGSSLNALKGISGGGNVISNATSKIGNAVSSVFPF